jgi:hypothetical protein
LGRWFEPEAREGLQDPSLKEERLLYVKNHWTHYTSRLLKNACSVIARSVFCDEAIFNILKDEIASLRSQRHVKYFFNSLPDREGT